MKVNHTITLDTELKKLLTKEGNVSGLINELLHKHYSTQTNTSISDVEIKIREIQDDLMEKEQKLIKLRYLLKDLELKKQSSPRCPRCKKHFEEGEHTETQVNNTGDIISRTHLNCKRVVEDVNA